MAYPCALCLTPPSSWSAIRLESPVSFTSYRSCLFTAPWPSGAAQGQGYWYGLCRPGRSNPAPLQALPLGVIRSSLAVPGGRGGSNSAGWILHHTHDGGNFLPPCVSYVFCSPCWLPVFFHSVLPSCTLGLLFNASGLVSATARPSTTPSVLVTPRCAATRWQVPRPAVPASPTPRALCITSTTNASHGLPSGISPHPVAPVISGFGLLGSHAPGRIVSLTDGLLGQLGSGRGSRIESPQLVFSAFTDSC